jgi:hypothetical protein
MRRGLAVAVALLALAVGSVGWANGFGGSDAPPARIPIPARNFSAVVEDLQGVRVPVTEVTYDGEVFLYGTFGEGQVTVPFEKIKEVRVEPTNEPTKRVAFVILADGSNVQLVIESDTLAYGRTSFGTYSIAVEKVRRIEFPAQ